jgi:sodium/potassium-transporting ATPase subunit alpha
MDSFRNMLPANCRVRRDGIETVIPATELVPGDIVVLQGGDKIPADIRLLSVAQMKVENSSITGESKPVRSTVEPEAPGGRLQECTNTCFNGSLCLEGAAVGVVLRTGDQTMIGRLALVTAAQGSGDSQLQREVQRFVYFIAVLAIAMAIVFFSIGVGRRRGDGVLNTFINGFLVVIVANVPQGLPATVVSLLTIGAPSPPPLYLFFLCLLPICLMRVLTACALPQLRGGCRRSTCM